MRNDGPPCPADKPRGRNGRYSDGEKPQSVSDCLLRLGAPRRRDPTTERKPYQTVGCRGDGVPLQPGDNANRLRERWINMQQKGQVNGELPDGRAAESEARLPL